LTGCAKIEQDTEGENGMSYEGERLKALRHEADMTQETLADLSGIDRTKIAKIEVGDRRMSASDAAFLAEALGRRANDLIERPRDAVRWRVEGQDDDPSVDRVGSWFSDFVDDALYLERRAARYGLG
jgi:transcriptional regulator with XRE-family HTH domain